MKSSLFLAASLTFLCFGCKTNQNVRKSKNDNYTITSQKVAIQSSMASVQGVIIDDNNKEAIPLAKIILTDYNGKQFVGLSNESGRFEIINVPAGKYNFFVHALDYKRINTEIELLAANKYTFDIKLNQQIMMLEKPVIYLYPSTKQKIHVELNYDGKLTHTYPTYTEKGWNILAEPNGTLFDENAMEYYALFWEGKPNKPLEAKDGFIVSGKETSKFLEEKLAYLGLNRRESNEFIMYWLPRMENNPYNLIHFSGIAYEKLAQLTISPQPETIIRVMMLTKPLTTKIDLPKQDLIQLKKSRKGFTVVEWGGISLENASANR